MRIKLPKGIQVEIDRFTVVAIALTIPAVVVWVISFGLTGDVDALLVGWGSSALVGAGTGYVIFRLTGWSLKSAPKAMRRIIKFYFWIGAWFVAAAITDSVADQGGAAAFHLAASNVAPAVVISLVLGFGYLAAATD